MAVCKTIPAGDHWLVRLNVGDRIDCYLVAIGPAGCGAIVTLDHNQARRFTSEAEAQAMADEPALAGLRHRLEPVCVHWIVPGHVDPALRCLTGPVGDFVDLDDGFNPAGSGPEPVEPRTGVSEREALSANEI